jgi:hypothetical protein
MSETQNSAKLFAFGDFETDSPAFETTCECPMSQALGAQRTSELYENSSKVKHIIQYYDEACSEYNQNEYVGFITEEEAQKVWHELLTSLEDNSQELDNTEFDSTYALAYHVAHKLGWIDT